MKTVSLSAQACRDIANALELADLFVMMKMYDSMSIVKPWDTRKRIRAYAYRAQRKWRSEKCRLERLRETLIQVELIEPTAPATPKPKGD
jgi:hypothetical protein